MWSATVEGATASAAAIFAGNLLATLFIVGVLCLKRRRRHDAAVPVREAPFAVRKSPKPV